MSKLFFYQSLLKKDENGLIQGCENNLYLPQELTTEDLSYLIFYQFNVAFKLLLAKRQNTAEEINGFLTKSFECSNFAIQSFLLSFWKEDVNKNSFLEIFLRKNLYFPDKVIFRHIHLVSSSIPNIEKYKKQLIENKDIAKVFQTNIALQEINKWHDLFNVMLSELTAIKLDREMKLKEDNKLIRTKI